MTQSDLLTAIEQLQHHLKAIESSTDIAQDNINQAAKWCKKKFTELEMHSSSLPSSPQINKKLEEVKILYTLTILRYPESFR